MTDLSDVERDALKLVEVLSGLTRGPARRENQLDDDPFGHGWEMEAVAAARRVLAYLRGLRAAGDGEAAVRSSRLGSWREWCPPGGNLLITHPHGARMRPPRPRSAGRLGHGDPGE